MDITWVKKKPIESRADPEDRVNSVKNQDMYNPRKERKNQMRYEMYEVCQETNAQGNTT